MITMSKVDELCEQHIGALIEEMIAKNDFWERSYFPEKVGFQRFGLQLREEDLEQSGISYLGFSLRDRSGTRKANSGFSVVTNTAEEFKVELDVWPFKKDDLLFYIVRDKYFMVKGEHAERIEDNSICSRSFQRHYMLPRGSLTDRDSVKCDYCNGIIIVTFKKGKVAGLQAKSVPITPAESEGVLSEVIYKSSAPTEVQYIPIEDSSYSDTVSRASEPAIEVPTVGKEPENNYALASNFLEMMKQIGVNPKDIETLEKIVEAAGLPKTIAQESIKRAYESAKETANASNGSNMPVKI